MFGTYRYTLALLVVLSHLWPSLNGWGGFYAVFGFYVLSGYLMATVLNSVYGFSAAGSARFLSNRLLRLLPPYYAVLALAALTILLFPDQARSLCGAVRFPRHVQGWLHNVFLLGLNRDVAMMVPPAWSLDVELRAYVAMAFLLTRWRRVTVVWLAVSLLYTVFMHAEGYTFADRYFRPVSASLPFSLGATLYFFRDLLPSFPPRFALLGGALFGVHTFAAGSLWADPCGGGLYVSLAISSILTVFLASLDRAALPDFLVKADARLGDLSYPLFLSHWPAAILLSGAGVFREKGPSLFLGGLLLAHVISLTFLLPLEGRVAGLRQRLRAPSPAERRPLGPGLLPPPPGPLVPPAAPI